MKLLKILLASLLILVISLPVLEAQNIPITAHNKSIKLTTPIFKVLGDSTVFSCDAGQVAFWGENGRTCIDTSLLKGGGAILPPCDAGKYWVSDGAGGFVCADTITNAIADTDTTFISTQEYLLAGADTIGVVKFITQGTYSYLDTTYFPIQDIATNYIPRRVLYSDSDSASVTDSPIWISSNKSLVLGGENEVFPNSFRGLFNYSHTDFGSSRFGFNLLKVGYNSANDPNKDVINALVMEAVDSTTMDFTRLQMGVYGNTNSGFKPQLAETIRINFESNGNGTATIGTEPTRPVKYIDFVTDINAIGTGYSAFKSALRIGMIDYSIDGESYKKGQFVEGFYTSSSSFLNKTTVTGVASYDDLGRRFRTDFDAAVDIAINKRLFATNAAAAAFFSVGQFYYNTTDEKLTRVQ